MMVTDRFLVCSPVGRRFIGKNRLDRSCAEGSLTFREISNNASSHSTMFFASFAAPTKIRFIQLDFSFESACFQLADTIRCFPQSLADSRDRLVIRSRIDHQAIRRLPFIDSESSFRLAAKRFTFLLCSAFATPDMPTFLPTHAG